MEPNDAQTLKFMLSKLVRPYDKDGSRQLYLNGYTSRLNGDSDLAMDAEPFGLSLCGATNGKIITRIKKHGTAHRRAHQAISEFGRYDASSTC